MISSAPRRNIELKARCRDLAAAERAALQLGAAPAGILEQVDTYFHVPNGRLKLRETDGKPAELIWYARADSVEFRGSDYYVIPVADAVAMKEAMTRAMGVRGAVRKRRTLLLWENVRIHLDRVDGLGDFLEFEAVISDATSEVISHQRLGTLATALSIHDDDRQAVSYSDLLGI